MLVLSRKPGEEIVVDGRIVIRAIGTDGQRLIIGIHAPPDVPIHRREVQDRLIEEWNDGSLECPTIPAA